jgi:phage tail protein X
MILNSPTRWDTLAQKYYGDISKMGVIIDANPSLTIYEIIPAGANVIIPTIAQESVVDNSQQPPWKQ